MVHTFSTLSLSYIYWCLVADTICVLPFYDWHYTAYSERDRKWIDFWNLSIPSPLPFESTPKYFWLNSSTNATRSMDSTILVIQSEKFRPIICACAFDGGAIENKSKCLTFIHFTTKLHPAGSIFDLWLDLTCILYISCECHILFNIPWDTTIVLLLRVENFYGVFFFAIILIIKPDKIIVIYFYI